MYTQNEILDLLMLNQDDERTIYGPRQSGRTTALVLHALTTCLTHRDRKTLVVGAFYSDTTLLKRIADSSLQLFRGLVDGEGSEYVRFINGSNIHFSTRANTNIDNFRGVDITDFYLDNYDWKEWDRVDNMIDLYRHWHPTNVTRVKELV